MKIIFKKSGMSSSWNDIQKTDWVGLSNGQRQGGDLSRLARFFKFYYTPLVTFFENVMSPFFPRWS
jgi:hypothetical protein